MIPSLRPYQSGVVNNIRKAAESARRVLVVAPTGSGKTIMFSHIAYKAAQKHSRVFVLVHRQEILRQTIQKLAMFGLQPGVIKAGERMTSNYIQVAMVQTLYKRVRYLGAAQPKLIITDECVSGNTMVACFGKEKRIKDVRPGEFVHCFDHARNRMCIRKVLAVHKIRSNTPMVSNTFTNGRRLLSTIDHMVFTPDGYKPADSIDMAHCIMSQFPYGRESKHRAMCNMRKTRKNGNKMASRTLSCQRVHASSGSVCKRILSPNIIENNGRNKSQVCICPDEKEKPHARSCHTRENGNNTSCYKTQAKNTRRQWPRTNGATKIDCLCSRMGHGSNCAHAPEKKQRLSKPLQNRCGEYGAESRDRNRRPFSLRSEPTSQRQEKRGLFAGHWLADTQVQKSRSVRRFRRLFRARYVYDLTVEDCHNYFANGILVHNCHHAPAGTYKKIIDAFPKAVSLGFTATPARTDGKGLDDMYDTMVQGPQTRELVDGGYLSQPIVLSSPMAQQIFHAPAKMKKGEYDADNETVVMGEKKIVNETVEMYSLYFKGSPAVIFCASLADCETVAASMRASGWKCESVRGDMDGDLRQEYISGLGTGRLNAICSYEVLGEGVDIPILAGIIMRRRTTSIIVYLQEVGRALRIAPGKSHALIIDQVGNTFFHGHPLEHREWSLKGIEKNAKEIKVKTCPYCDAILAGFPHTCPYCARDITEGKPKVKTETATIFAPLQIIHPPDVGEGAIEAAEIFAYSAGDREQALIERTLDNVHHGDMGLAERFKVIMKYLGKTGVHTEAVYKKYILPEMER